MVMAPERKARASMHYLDCKIAWREVCKLSCVLGCWCCPMPAPTAMLASALREAQAYFKARIMHNHLLLVLESPKRTLGQVTPQPFSCLNVLFRRLLDYYTSIAVFSHAER